MSTHTHTTYDELIAVARQQKRMQAEWKRQERRKAVKAGIAVTIIAALMAFGCYLNYRGAAQSPFVQAVTSAATSAQQYDGVVN